MAQAILTEPPLEDFELNKDSPFAEGLVGWWPMLPFNSDFCRDLSGYNSHGELINFAGASDWAREAELQGAASLNFDDTDNVIGIIDSGVQGHVLDILNDITIFCILNRRTDSVTPVSRRDGTPTVYQLFLTSSDVRLRVNTGTSTSTGNICPADTWIAVGVASDLQDTGNGAAEFFVRNLETGSFVTEAPADAHGAASTQAIRTSIGARWNSDPTTSAPMDGPIAEVRMYDQRKTADWMEQATHPSNIWDLRWIPRKRIFLPVAAAPAGGRIMGSLIGHSGLIGEGGGLII